MLLDGLLVHLLEFLPVLAIQEDSIAIIEFSLGHGCFGELVQNVLTMRLRIGQLKNAVFLLLLLQFLEGVPRDVGMAY